MNAFDQLDRVHTASSEVFGRAIAKAGGAACGDNCPACCREPVYASKLEAERIVALLTEEEKAALKTKLEPWLKAFYASGQETTERPNVYNYIPVMPPCPILKGTRCSVYDHRPTECRAHFAFKHRSYCEDIDKRREQKHAYFNDELLKEIMFANLKIEGRMTVDHLCILLAEILIGPQPETEARHQYIAEFK